MVECSLECTVNSNLERFKIDQLSKIKNHSTFDSTVRSKIIKISHYFSGLKSSFQFRSALFDLTRLYNCCDKVKRYIFVVILFKIICRYIKLQPHLVRIGLLNEVVIFVMNFRLSIFYFSYVGVCLPYHCKLQLIPAQIMAY